MATKRTLMGDPLKFDPPERTWGQWGQQTFAPVGGPVDFAAGLANNLAIQPLGDILAGKPHKAAASYQLGSRDPVTGAELAKQGFNAAGVAALGSMVPRAPPGLRSGLPRPELDMSQAARLARAKAQGYDTGQPLYHGSPDYRGIDKSGAFEKRTRNAENRGDPVEYKRLQDEMNAERSANGTSDKYFDLLNKTAAMAKTEKVPQAIYLSNDKNIARSYMDEHRAADYQNAEAGMFSGYTKGNMLDVSARGQKFSNVSISDVRSQLPENLRTKFDDIINRYADPTGRGKIRTGDMEVIAHKLGFDGFKLRQVKDAYDGTGKASTVSAVFDPSNIRSPNAAFDPAKASSANLLSANNKQAAAAAAAFRAAQQDGGLAPPPKDLSQYVDGRAYDKSISEPYWSGGVQKASSRDVPFEGILPDVGVWRVGETNGLYGRDIHQLRRVPIKDLDAPETIHGLDPTKRGDDARYAQWLQEGRRSPPIEVIQRDDGSLRVLDGHRRLMGANQAGRKDIEAWVNDSVPVPGGKLDSNGKPIMTGRTFGYDPSKASANPTPAAFINSLRGNATYAAPPEDSATSGLRDYAAELQKKDMTPADRMRAIRAAYQRTGVY